MPLGWIDFSKTERNKVLTVLDLLSENGTLDELGIATIRDGFSDLWIYRCAESACPEFWKSVVRT